MEVTVRLYASLARSVSGPVLKQHPQGVRSGSPLEVELPDGSTLADLVNCLGLPVEEVKVVFVDGRARRLEHRLAPEDEIGIFPPIGGG